MAGEVRSLFHRFVRRQRESRDNSEAISCSAIDTNDGEGGFRENSVRVCVRARVCVCEVLCAQDGGNGNFIPVCSMR